MSRKKFTGARTVALMGVSSAAAFGGAAWGTSALLAPLPAPAHPRVPRVAGTAAEGAKTPTVAAARPPAVLPRMARTETDNAAGANPFVPVQMPAGSQSTAAQSWNMGALGLPGMGLILTAPTADQTPKPGLMPLPAGTDRLELVGTLLGDTPSAVLRGPSALATVPVGGAFGGWTVVSVSHGEAVIKSMREIVRLTPGGTSPSDSGRRLSMPAVSEPVSRLDGFAAAAPPPASRLDGFTAAGPAPALRLEPLAAATPSAASQSDRITAAAPATVARLERHTAIHPAPELGRIAAAPASAPRLDRHAAVSPAPEMDRIAEVAPAPVSRHDSFATAAREGLNNARSVEPPAATAVSAAAVAIAEQAADAGRVAVETSGSDDSLPPLPDTKLTPDGRVARLPDDTPIAAESDPSVEPAKTGTLEPGRVTGLRPFRRLATIAGDPEPAPALPNREEAHPTASPHATGAPAARAHTLRRHRHTHHHGHHHRRYTHRRPMHQQRHIA